ncbi:hypothetical protein [Polyangium aurulentum]|uniref:hypothetical protein n=1 Tax=Polyangium aurulentum TaxID=2567896 RepID=UPI0010AE335B|nr:hypothetical protein [Polyangium aurulentum]UQA56926.1 hypothetical protein E8A73_037380 [Polyangium aurulentum]
MDRKNLSFRIVALLLGASATAWVLGRALEPSVPEPVATSKSEPHDSSTPSPRRDRAAHERDTAVSPAQAQSIATTAETSRPRPRPATEWQGMKVDDAETWPCGERCSMARACIGGLCVPCREDAQCEAGEVCVLDHCVVEERVECRRAADCGNPEALCVLTGYTSGDLRGNGEMRAHCSNPEGGQPDGEDELAADDEDDDAVAAAATEDRSPPGSSVVDELRNRARRR